MKIIKFAKDYPKLQEDLFTTIRRPPKKLRLGQCIIKSPKNEFKAVLVRKTTLNIRDIETSVLSYDTDTRSRDEAIEALKEYYPELVEDSEVQVLWFVPDRSD